jgi:hypothetical protein
LARSLGCVRIVDVEVGVDAISGLPAQLTRAVASPAIEARSNRTVQYSSTSLASSSRAWASCALMSAPLGGKGGGALGPAARRDPVPRAGGTSPSPAPVASAALAGSLAMTTQHSRVGS